MPRYEIAIWPIHHKEQQRLSIIEADNRDAALTQAYELAGFGEGFDVLRVVPDPPPPLPEPEPEPVAVTLAEEPVVQKAPRRTTRRSSK